MSIFSLAVKRIIWGGLWWSRWDETRATDTEGQGKHRGPPGNSQPDWEQTQDQPKLCLHTATHPRRHSQTPCHSRHWNPGLFLRLSYLPRMTGLVDSALLNITLVYFMHHLVLLTLNEPNVLMCVIHDI